MLLTSAAIMNDVMRVRFAVPRQRDRVEHQAHLLVEAARNADGRIRQRDVRQIVRFHLLHAALDLAHALEVVSRASRRSRGPTTFCKAAGLVGDDVENARRTAPRARSRSSGVSPWPNSRWNSLRGLNSIGSGVDGVRNEIVAP